MNGSNKKCILPVRTPGAVWLRQGVTSEATLHSARPRASASHRGVSEAGTELAKQPRFLLADLIKELRKDVAQFPLTILIHGWGSDPALEFLKVLLRLLHEQDAVWLIPTEKKTLHSHAPPIERAVVLMPDQDADYHTYMNLVGDLVFFSATEEVEANYIPMVRGRARVLISYGTSADNEALLAVARETGLTIYSWLEGKTLSPFCGPPETLLLTELKEQEQDEAILAKLGRMLKEMAEHLENEYDRRPRFRAELDKVLATYPGRPSWHRDLVELGDKYEWPLWTVESLPFVYVPLEQLPDGRQGALIWRLALDCAPEELGYQVFSRLWHEQFLKIYMPTEAAPVILAIAQTLEDSLSSFPFPSERSFAGAINNAMQQIEIFVGGKYPEAATKVREMRKGILKRVHVIPLTTSDPLTN